MIVLPTLKLFVARAMVLVPVLIVLLYLLYDLMEKPAF